jgi:poly [ADP-ribose] polymerase
LPRGKHSTKGVGRTAPAESFFTQDGVEIPLGTCKETNIKESALLYNEYLTFNLILYKIH